MYRFALESISRRTHHLVARQDRLAWAAASATVLHVHLSSDGKGTATTSLEPNPSDKDKEKTSSTSLDLTKELERAKSDFEGYLQTWGVFTDDGEKGKQAQESEHFEKDKDSANRPTASVKDRLERLFSARRQQEEDTAATQQNDKLTLTESADFLSSMVKDVTSVLFSPNQERKEKAVQSLIETAHQTVQSGDTHKEGQNLLDVFKLLSNSLSQAQEMIQKNLGHVDLTEVSLNSLYYYVEKEDERKNPSWKRRKHRFHPGIDYERVLDLNEALYLADIAYLDSVEEIKESLKEYSSPVEMIYCDTESFPGRPSHFLLLKKDQSIWSSDLEMILVVRGSKTIPDVITDCLLDAVDYQDGGKVHAGILESGLYLVDKHLPLLQTLRKWSKKRKIKLTLIGHSLGAGAASIAGMEFRRVPEIEVQVVGFGCPALLSKELSESTRSYITTVINDSDLVPRMSGATVANALVDIMEYDWTEKARADTEHALQELQRVAPSILSASSRKKLLSTIDASIEQFAKSSIREPSSNRMAPQLFPPGTCIHFYHDGQGITASKAPCTFFDEIDITRRMVDDHLIQSGYHQVLLDLVRQHKRDQNFSFDDLKR